MKLGRNEPCRCGSGKKYKHCHYDEDQKAESARLAEEAAVRAAKAQETVEGESSEDAGSGETRSRPADRRSGSSRFMRDSVKDGGRSKGKGPTSSRATRGSQRGG